MDKKKLQYLMITPFLLMAFIAIFGLSSCSSDSPEETTTDTCSVSDIKISPDRVYLMSGDVYTFNATCYDDDNNRITTPVTIRWSTNSSALYVNPTTGVARIYSSSSSEIQVFATAHNCEGIPVVGTARVQISDMPGFLF